MLYKCIFIIIIIIIPSFALNTDYLTPLFSFGKGLIQPKRFRFTTAPGVTLKNTTNNLRPRDQKVWMTSHWQNVHCNYLQDINIRLVRYNKHDKALSATHVPRFSDLFLDSIQIHAKSCMVCLEFLQFF